MTLLEAKEFIRSLENPDAPHLEDDSEDLQAAVIVWMGGITGKHNAKELHLMTGYDKSLIIRIISNMYENRLWVNGKWCLEFDEEKDDALSFVIEFWLHVGCALGTIKPVYQHEL